jgi:hypothetical protein
LVKIVEYFGDKKEQKEQKKKNKKKAVIEDEHNILAHLIKHRANKLILYYQ